MLLGAVSGVLQIVGVVLNGAVALVVWRKTLNRIPSTRFVFSLSLSHFLLCGWSLGVGVVQLPPAILLQDITIYSNLLVSIASSITLTLISLERYVTIARPMEYRGIVTPLRCFLSLCLTWALSLVLLIPLFPLSSSSPHHLYLPLLLSSINLSSITIMTLCYSHIFKIARDKCKKVRLGVFRGPGSISSDWPSSVHPSHPTHLLHQQQLKNNRRRGGLVSPLLYHPLPTKKRRAWGQFGSNHNSPKKTVLTILLLLGSVALTSLPPLGVLLLSPTHYLPLQQLLFSLSSILNPLLYGLLNRTIRHYLWPRRRKSRGFNNARTIKRKLSSVPPIFKPCRRPLEPEVDNYRYPSSTPSPPHEEQVQEEEEEVGQEVIIINLPRKGSQDSGADMAFSEEDDEEEDEVAPPPPFFIFRSSCSQSSLNQEELGVPRARLSKSMEVVVVGGLRRNSHSESELLLGLPAPAYHATSKLSSSLSAEPLNLSPSHNRNNSLLVLGNEYLGRIKTH